MNTTRLEAFSDGVIAIIITIMVLELKVPHDVSVPALLALAPVFLSYALSFVVVAIFWVNHHHLLHLARSVDAKVLWANIHLLFWLSLVPFATNYLGEHHSEPLAVALYGFDLFAAAVAMALLSSSLPMKHRGTPEGDALHRRAVRKNLITTALYGASVPLAWVSIWISIGVFVLIPIVYFMPSGAAQALVKD